MRGITFCIVAALIAVIAMWMTSIVEGVRNWHCRMVWVNWLSFVRRESAE